jgi:hypothetical protein
MPPMQTSMRAAGQALALFFVFAAAESTMDRQSGPPATFGMLANLKVQGQPVPPLVQLEGFVSVNKLFKWLTLLLGYLFLAVFSQFSQNGRYVVHDTEQAVMVADTRTGEVSWPRNNQPRSP